MRIAYLVLAHADPVHLHRLVNAIASDRADVFVHIDQKSDLQRFEALPLIGPNVHVVRSRVKVYWGQYSQVEAILTLIRAAMSANAAFSRFVLLSGADYPLRSTAYIEKFFEKQPQVEFMNLVPIPCNEAGKPLSRITSFWPRHGHHLSFVETKLRRAAVRFGLKTVERDHRRALQATPPFGGSTWWALTRAACAHMLNFVEQQTDVVRFFTNTVYPDELMPHTIIGNSPFRPMVRRNVTYTDWRKGGSNPAPIDADHVAQFESVQEVSAHDAYGAGEVLFARKLGDQTQLLVDRIEVMRERKFI